MSDVLIRNWKIVKVGSKVQERDYSFLTETCLDTKPSWNLRQDFQYVVNTGKDLVIKLETWNFSVSEPKERKMDTVIYSGIRLNT